jgi:SAM-dependent methyltransferase
VLQPADPDVPIAALKDRGWRRIAAVDAALRAGEIDEQGWHTAMAALVRPIYLAARTPWGQSGKSGGEADWMATRRFVVDALDRDGTFLDCGCANGYLMECVRRWAAAKGLDVQPYGVDIVADFVELARARLPQWAGRVWVGNVLSRVPPFRFDAVRVGLEYVPEHRRPDLVEHLLHKALAERGRLIVGPYTEEAEHHATEDDLTAWGHVVAGRSELPHADPRVVRRLVWIDAHADRPSVRPRC